MMSSWAVYVKVRSAVKKRATLMNPCKVTSPAGKPFVGILAEEDFDGEFVQALLAGQLALTRFCASRANPAGCGSWLTSFCAH